MLDLSLTFYEDLFLSLEVSPDLFLNETKTTKSDSKHIYPSLFEKDLKKYQ